MISWLQLLWLYEANFFPNSCLAIPAVEMIVWAVPMLLACASISVKPVFSCWLCPNCLLATPRILAFIPTIAVRPFARVSVAAFCADTMRVCPLLAAIARVIALKISKVLFPVPGGPILGSICDLRALWAAPYIWSAMVGLLFWSSSAMSRTVPSFPLILMLLPIVGASALMLLSSCLIRFSFSYSKFPSFTSKPALAKSCAIMTSFPHISLTISSNVAMQAWADWRALIGTRAGLFSFCMLASFVNPPSFHSWSKFGSAP